MRGFADRLRQRERHIKRRISLIVSVGGTPRNTPGFFDKTKAFDCSCWMCSGHAKFRFRRGRERHGVKAMLRMYEEES